MAEETEKKEEKETEVITPPETEVKTDTSMSIEDVMKYVTDIEGRLNNLQSAYDTANPVDENPGGEETPGGDDTPGDSGDDTPPAEEEKPSDEEIEEVDSFLNQN